MATVTITRHRSVRVHETIRVEIDDTMLDDERYFDEDGTALGAFDQFACDNGEVIMSDSEPLDDDGLTFDVEEVA